MDKWLAPAEAVHLTAAAYKSCYLATTTKVRQSVDDLYKLLQGDKQNLQFMLIPNPEFGMTVSLSSKIDASFRSLRPTHKRDVALTNNPKKER